MQMRFNKALLASALLAASTQSPAAINLVFDYSRDALNFFDIQARRDVLETAGAYFETRINDNLGAITSGGGNSFNITFSNPATGNDETINNFSVAADELHIFAGGHDLGGNTLGVGGPGGYSVSGTPEFVNTTIHRGQSGVATNTDFAPWGGSIAFDTNPSGGWYFDPDVSTSADIAGNDFYSVALHELGHLLGFGIANSWNAQLSGSSFAGTESVAAHGGNVPLDSDLAHWLDGTTGLLNGVQVETAMDPIIQTGTRKEFTDLDLAALSDIGWEATVVPIPAAAWLFGSALFGLIGLGRPARA